MIYLVKFYIVIIEHVQFIDYPVMIYLDHESNDDNVKMVTFFL